MALGGITYAEPRLLVGCRGASPYWSLAGCCFHRSPPNTLAHRVLPVTGSGGEAFEVQARGELQLGLLIGAESV